MAMAVGKKMVKVLDLNNLSIEENQVFQSSIKGSAEFVNNIVSEYLLKNEGDLDYYFSEFASRNPFQSQLIDKIIALRTIFLLLKSDSYNIVKLHDPQLCSVVEDFVKQNHIGTRVVNNASLSTKFQIAVRPIKRFIGSVLYIFRQFFFKYILNRNYKNLPTTGIVLADTNILPACIKNGEIRERNFPDLDKYLTKEEYSKLFFLPTFVSITNFFQMYRQLFRSKSQHKWVLKEDYLKFMDYLYIFTHGLRLKKLKNRFKDCYLEGVDISSLLNKIYIQGWGAHTSLNALTNYRTIQRMKERGVVVKKFVNWYENHVTGRAYNLALEKFYPDCKRVGYCGVYLDLDYNAYLCPTSSLTSSVK